MQNGIGLLTCISSFHSLTERHFLISSLYHQELSHHQHHQKAVHYYFLHDLLSRETYANCWKPSDKLELQKVVLEQLMLLESIATL